MKAKLLRHLFASVLILLGSTAAARAVTMAYTPVPNLLGNAGNPPDTVTPNPGYGSVNYSYNIGTYDVTASQYVEFLNANDPTGANPLGLYNSNMSNASFGGINAYNGSTYTVVAGRGNHPVNYVTWYDAIRFANWLDNRQPVFGTEPTALNNATEGGAYTLAGFLPTPTNGLSITRNAGASVFLPSEDEWYKAAYYNPATSSHFLYPTSSTSPAPTASAATALANHANFAGAVGNLTDVGAYSGTTSPYGAYDMGGDVFQWNEALISGSSRGFRGGGFGNSAANLQSSGRGSIDPTLESGVAGFRVASSEATPEPASIVLTLSALGMFLIWSKRLRANLFSFFLLPFRIDKPRRPVRN